MKKIIVPMPKRLVELIDENRDELDRETFIKVCIDHTLHSEKRKSPQDAAISNEESTEGSESIKELPWQNSFNRAWLVAFLSYGIGDAAASFIALQLAGSFADPVMAFLFKKNFLPVIPFKITILFSGLVISYYLLEKKTASLIIPVMLSIAGILFIIINIAHSIGIR